MKGAGKVPFLDFDPEEDSRSLATFQGDEGKTTLEQLMMSKIGREDRTWKPENGLHV